jgi:redox-sensitive bicupin YhaK (pirin superfamily)
MTHLSPGTSFPASASYDSSCEASSGKPIIRVVPNSKLYVSEPNPRMFGNKENMEDDPSWTNANWLKSRFHFSFAEYRNSGNNNFGVLRVMNDDLVQPHRGFGTHGHSNAEILTYVVEGKLTHQDSIGTKESLGRGSIQFMTAGSGVRHSEHNIGDTPLRFIQTWIVPKSSGLEPNYGSMDGSTTTEARRNKVHHLVSSVDDTEVKTPVKINQSVDGYAGELELGKTVTIDLPTGRQAYLLCIEGGIQVNGKRLEKHGACEIMGGGLLEISAEEVEPTESGDVAHFLLYSMPELEGSGRSDL